MSIKETIPVRDAVVAYLSATGSSPSLVYQILAELHEPGVLSLDLLGDPLPYFIEDVVQLSSVRASTPSWPTSRPGHAEAERVRHSCQS